jgi:integrase
MNPFFKKSHKAWYVNLNGKQVRLGADEAMARTAFARLVGVHDYTVAEMIELFLAQPRKESTQSFYRQGLAPLTQHGHLYVKDLKVHHVQGCRNVLRAAKTCFKWAEDQQYIERSPLHGLKVPPATSRGDEAYLTPEQVNRLLRSMKGDLLDLAVVMKDTGCRPQEIRRVESRHFDREGRCWVFPKNESKGRQSQRVVHLSDRAYAICQRLALKHPVGPLFRRGAMPWTARALCRQFQRRGITSYCLRHTFATEALLHGVDMQTLAVLLGHTDLKMLSRIYQHIRRRADFIKEGLRKVSG